VSCLSKVFKEFHIPSDMQKIDRIIDGVAHLVEAARAAQRQGAARGAGPGPSRSRRAGPSSCQWSSWKKWRATRGGGSAAYAVSPRLRRVAPINVLHRAPSLESLRERPDVPARHLRPVDQDECGTVRPRLGGR
jgi:hypothetical protein